MAIRPDSPPRTVDLSAKSPGVARGHLWSVGPGSCRVRSPAQHRPELAPTTVTEPDGTTLAAERGEARLTYPNPANPDLPNLCRRSSRAITRVAFPPLN